MWIYVEENCFASVDEATSVITIGDYEKSLYLNPSVDMLKQVINYAEKKKSGKRKHKREEVEIQNDSSPSKRQKVEPSNDNSKRSTGYMSKKPKHLKLIIPPRTKLLIDEVDMWECESAMKEKLLNIYTKKIDAEIMRLMRENCYGCVNDCPSQKDHDLCIDTSYSELIEKFLEEAKSNIDYNEIFEIFNKEIHDSKDPLINGNEISQFKKAEWLESYDDEQLKITLKNML